MTTDNENKGDGVKNERDKIRAFGTIVTSAAWVIATYAAGKWLSLMVGDLAIFAAGMAFMIIVIPKL